MIGSCAYLKGRWGAVLAGLAVLSMAAPRAAWGQSSWPSYPNNSTITVTSGGNVGIGTTNPAAPLHVYTPPGLAAYGVFGSGAGSGTDGLNVGNNNGSASFVNAHGASGNGVLWLMTDYTTRMTINSMGVGIGTTNPQYLLSVNGQIGAKDVIVTNSGWSDYVFQPGYRLRPLSEVNAYIESNHHLPDIPSEAEVNEKGVSVNEMQKKLLAKVEELTLHMIQQEKDNQELRAHMAEQEKQNQELRERLVRIERSAAADRTPVVAK